MVYCYPMVQPHIHDGLAANFVNTWLRYPPGAEHTFHVGANGGEASPIRRKRFEPLKPTWHQHNNVGWDIGLYQQLAQIIDCDLMVCLGAHIQFNHPGWLARIVDSYVYHGPGLFGPWGTMYPNPHIRTTAFWCSPQLLQSYPVAVTSQRSSRYQFEHGRRSFTNHTLGLGLPCVMVTMRGCFPYPNWKDYQPTGAESIILDKQHQ